MSPRTGRPKAENPKNNQICVRLEAETAEMLQAFCAERGITKGEVIRQGIELLVSGGKGRKTR